MTSADFYYPGFEHAGLQSPLERAVTWSFCHTAMALVSLRMLTGHIIERLSPRLQPQFDA